MPPLPLLTHPPHCGRRHYLSCCCQLFQGSPLLVWYAALVSCINVNKRDAGHLWNVDEVRRAYEYVSVWNMKWNERWPNNERRYVDIVAQSTTTSLLKAIWTFYEAHQYTNVESCIRNRCEFPASSCDSFHPLYVLPSTAWNEPKEQKSIFCATKHIQWMVILHATQERT